MDYVIAHDNRLWGCRYGYNDDEQFVNEIYASALGDPTRWFQFDMLADASYTVSIGEPGKWTGCAEIGGNVVFFKENCMFTVYGDYPAEYSVVKTSCDGIQDGCSKSVINVNGYLFYKAKRGFMRMATDSLPVRISENLGVFDSFGDVYGATDGQKLYYDVQSDEDGRRLMFVYDTLREVWHREDRFDSGDGHLIRVRNSVLSIGNNAQRGAQILPYIRGDLQEPEGLTGDAKELFDLVEAGDVYKLNTQPSAEWNAYYINEMEIETYEPEQSYAAGSVVTYGGKILYCTEPVEAMAEGDWWTAEEEFFERIAIEAQTVCVTTLHKPDVYLPAMNYYGAVSYRASYAFHREPRGEFMLMTGDIGLSDPDVKQLKKLEIRAKLYDGATMDVSVMYDADGTWHDLMRTEAPGFDTKTYTGLLARCDSFRLRIHGNGRIVIYSITASEQFGGNTNV